MTLGHGRTRRATAVTVLLAGIAAIGLIRFAAGLGTATRAVGASPPARPECSSLVATAPALREAMSRAAPGDVVCLTARRIDLRNGLYITRSGSPTKWITITSFNQRRPSTIRSLQRAPESLVKLTGGAAYIRFLSLHFLNAAHAQNAVHCTDHSHHVDFEWNRVEGFGSSGFASKRCDYLFVTHNQFWRTGYERGWGSAVSYGASVAYDAASGFHSLIADNVISGTTDESFHHSDGNGIIIDRGGPGSPPVLIANNVVYYNGGRCIEALRTGHVWAVNNTCFMNDLDPRVGSHAEMLAAGGAADDVHWINTVVVTHGRTTAYQVRDGATVDVRASSASGGLRAGPATWRVAPDFTKVPRLSGPTEGGQLVAPAPWRIGRAFRLSSGSGLVDAGVDPHSVAGLVAMLRGAPQLDAYITTDARGRPRPDGEGYDVGAYER